MKKRYSLPIIGCIIMVFILAAFFMSYNGQKASAAIDSAKELRINASEIGRGWEEVSFGYMSDPVNAIEELYRKVGENDLLELSMELRKDSVKDGYVLLIDKKISEAARDIIEVDVLVFNNIDGAKRFFEYMKNKKNGSSISGIGDEAAISSTGHSYIVRSSNAFIEVVFDEKETGRIIAEKIVEKATKC